MKDNIFARVTALVLFVLFMVALLLSLVAGVRVYSGLVTEKGQSDNLRFANGAIVNCIKGLDSYDSVRMDEGPEGPALAMVERVDAGTFVTRFYLCQGELLQEYVLAGQPYNPTTATVVMTTDSFGFQIDNSLLTIQTDEGATDIYLHAADQGAIGQGIAA